MSCAPQDLLVLVNEPGYLRVTMEENFVFVYRSVGVVDDSPLYRQVLEIVGDRKPVTVDLVFAPDMVHQQAEWLLFDMWM